MSIIGFILLVLGTIACLIGEIMIMVETLRRGAVLFVTCFFIPIAALVFVLVNVRRLWIPLILDIVGCLMFYGGTSIPGAEALARIIFE
jgi:hypothetical protein